MSTLTKVLVVLLTLSTIFLSGMVVTYVGSATNYKKAYEEARAANTALSEKVATLQTGLSEGLHARQTRIDELQKQLDQIVIENAAFRADALSLQTQNAGLTERVASWYGAVEKSQQIVADLSRQLTAARSELDTMRTELVGNRSQLSQVRTALEERTVQLDSLETQKMQLLEEKAALEARMAGRTTTAAGVDARALPITQTAGRARPAAGPTSRVALEGRISDVRIVDRVATVSIGSANGVQTGDVLHVLRNDQFICNIEITDVETRSAAGNITMLRGQLQPAAGDVVTNRL